MREDKKHCNVEFSMINDTLILLEAGLKRNRGQFCSSTSLRHG